MKFITFYGITVESGKLFSLLIAQIEKDIKRDECPLIRP